MNIVDPQEPCRACRGAGGWTESDGPGKTCHTSCMWCGGTGMKTVFVRNLPVTETEVEDIGQK